MTKILRCAIYTRKSSEEGLEQDFNSLDAQREACEAYIKSQRHEGWTLIEKQYDDGGFSGGTMNRPAFQNLLKDIESGSIDIVVVYKVDRLTRSLMDFAKIVEILDKHSTSFVSITQQFNTTTSMGRLTLNILLSFAQFEREVTGERIRDKFAASRKKGMWMNGTTPIGYKRENGKLVVIQSEADIIKTIFNKYLEIGSVPKLMIYLRNKEILTRKGKFFSRGHLYRILTNKVYIGKIEHKNEINEGLHDAIIDIDLFEKTNKLLSKNTLIRKNSVNAKCISLLKGKLFDDKNNYMSPSHSNKKGKRYRYYLSQAKIQQKTDNVGTVSRIPANEIEKFVIEKLKEYILDKRTIQKLFEQHSLQQQNFILEAMSNNDLDVNFIRHSIIKVILSKEQVLITISETTLKEAIEYIAFKSEIPSIQNFDDNTLITLAYKIRISSSVKNGCKLILGEINKKCVNETLTKAIAKSFYYHKLMFENKLSSEQKSNSYINRIMKLRFLPKEIIEAILTGNQEPDWTIDKLYKLV